MWSTAFASRSPGVAYWLWRPMRPSRVSTKVTTPTAPAHEADAERRHEHRFQVSESIARLVMRTTANNLPLSRDDRPYQWSTTTYCDTVSWNIFRAAEKGSAMQLRIRDRKSTRLNSSHLV